MYHQSRRVDEPNNEITFLFFFLQGMRNSQRQEDLGGGGGGCRPHRSLQKCLIKRCQLCFMGGKTTGKSKHLCFDKKWMCYKMIKFPLKLSTNQSALEMICNHNRQCILKQLTKIWTRIRWKSEIKWQNIRNKIYIVYDADIELTQNKQA